MPEWLQQLIATQITIPAVVSVLVYVGSALIQARINSGVQHGYDVKLERLRHEFELGQVALQEESGTRATQISALRDGALSALTSRRTALDARRIQAIERIWESATLRKSQKSAAKLTSVMRMDRALAAAAKGDAEAAKLQKFGQIIWDAQGLEKTLNLPAPDLERPFIRPYTWALFSTYLHAISIPVAQLGVLKTGVGPDALVDDATMLAPIKSALPERAKFIDEFGMRSLFTVLDDLENKLVEQLVRDLEGGDADAASVKLASDILVAVDIASAKKAAPPPPRGFEQEPARPS